MTGESNRISVCMLDETSEISREILDNALRSNGITVVPAGTSGRTGFRPELHEQAYQLSMDMATGRDWTGYILDYSEVVAVPAGRTLEQHQAIIALNKGRRGPHSGGKR